MKKFILKNWLVIIILFIMLVAISVCAIDELKVINSNYEYVSQKIIECKQNLEKRENNASYNAFCQQLVDNQNIKVDFYTAFTDVLVWKLHFLNPIAFLIVVIPLLYNICNKFKYKFIINSLTRQSYCSYVKSMLKEAYKYNWSLVLIIGTLIFILAINTTFDATYAINNSTIVWNDQLIKKPVLFIFLYLLNILMYSFTFANIGLIIAKKHHRFISCVILSYLVYLGTELFLEIGVTMIISNILFKSDFGIIFNIMNLFMFNDVFGAGTLLLFSFIVMMISFILLYFVYKNKENLVISCEKNN